MQLRACDKGEMAQTLSGFFKMQMFCNCQHPLDLVGDDEASDDAQGLTVYRCDEVDKGYGNSTVLSSRFLNAPPIKCAKCRS